MFGMVLSPFLTLSISQPAVKFNTVFYCNSDSSLPTHGHAAHVLPGSFLVVVRLVAHSDTLLLELPPAFSVDVLSHRGGGGHRVLPEDLAQVVEQSGGGEEAHWASGLGRSAPGRTARTGFPAPLSFIQSCLTDAIVLTRSESIVFFRKSLQTSLKRI